MQSNAPRERKQLLPLAPTWRQNEKKKADAEAENKRRRRLRTAAAICSCCAAVVLLAVLLALFVARDGGTSPSPPPPALPSALDTVLEDAAGQTSASSTFSVEGDREPESSPVILAWGDAVGTESGSGR